MWPAVIITGLLLLLSTEAPDASILLILSKGLIGVALCWTGLVKLGSGAKREGYAPMRRSVWHGRRRVNGDVLGAR